jgi:hypothetical protein
MKLTRHKLWGNPGELHRLLNEPMRANKIPKRDRQQWIKEQTEARLEALFAEFHIPAEWPELFQWQWLAMGLAGKLYPGCRTIEIGRGGPKKMNRLHLQDERRRLFERFKTFHETRPTLSKSRAADLFIKANPGDCDTVKLRTPRVFLRSMRSTAGES